MPEQIISVGQHHAGYGDVPPDQPRVLPPDPPRPSLIGSDRLCFGFGFSTSAVHRALVHLFNPVPTSDEAPSFLITVEQIIVVQTTGQANMFLWRYDGITSGARVAQASTGARDTRLGRNDCIMQLWSDDVVIGSIPGLNQSKDLLGVMSQVAADVTNNRYDYELGTTLRLAPGTGFFVAAGTDGKILNVSFFVRERRVTEQELAQLVLD